MIRRRSILWIFCSLALLLVLGGYAFAEAAENAGEKKNAAGEALAFVALYILLWIGIGASMALLRVIVPRIADAADASARRLSTMRLLVGGILPLIGAALLATAVGAIDVPAVTAVFLIVVAIPLCLAVLAGGVAAVPRIGAKLLKNGDEQGVLKRSMIGGLVLGLTGVTAVAPLLAGFLAVLIAGWLVGIGVGTVVRPKARAPALD